MMRNKIELKKAIVNFFLILISFIIIFGIFEFYKYKIYNKNLNNKIGSIITKLSKEYPDINKNELIEIINSKNDINIDLFKKYGIDLSEDSLVLENDLYFTRFLYINILLIVILSVSFFYTFMKYNYTKDKKLKEITKYIEEINNKNYKLDIDDNTEDELSILKNEVYKTTIMLKEIAENSKKDKISLKNSLSDISHQLKTPLTSISILLDNILEDSNMDNLTRIEFEKDIKKEIININFLVATLLKLSKFDANSIIFINKKVKIKEILNNSIKNVSILCDLKNIEILIEGNCNAEINCDLKWQIEAITNILKNAVEHSHDNSKIIINCEENEVYSKIEIKDYGVGIEEEDLPHIFERFYKGKNSSSESVGIGLALAKSIIENNNGYISVESKLNNWTIFIMKYFK